MGMQKISDIRKCEDYYCLKTGLNHGEIQKSNTIKKLAVNR